MDGERLLPRVWSTIFWPIWLNLRYNFSSAPDGLSKTRLSTAIAVARVLCIFGVVYVHAWTGLDGGRLTLADSSTQGVFRWVLMEIGRASCRERGCQYV